MCPNPVEPPPNNAGFPYRRLILPLMIVTAYVGIVWILFFGITGFFRLGGETAALRQAVAHTSQAELKKKLTLSVGGFSTGLVRLGSRFFNLPREPRAALDAVRGAEVGLFTLPEPLARAHHVTILAEADKVMTKRGWTRLVGVSEGTELVAIYVPSGELSARKIRCCVMVLDRQELVLVSAAARLNPLLELARQEFHVHEQLKNLGWFGSDNPAVENGHDLLARLEE